MARTTINIDDPILRDLKKIQKKEGKSLGALVSELVALGLSARKMDASKETAFEWIARPLGARVDFNDKEALYRLMEE